MSIVITGATGGLGGLVVQHRWRKLFPEHPSFFSSLVQVMTIPCVFVSMRLL